jgi:hypothetical protein
VSAPIAALPGLHADPTLAALGVLLACALLPVCAFTGSDSRRRDDARLDASWTRLLRPHGLRLAALAAGLQLAGAWALCGPAAGVGLLLAGWMTLGQAFVPLANAWPASTVRGYLIAGALGGLLMAASVLR